MSSVLSARLHVDFDDVLSREHAVPRWSEGRERRVSSRIPVEARDLVRRKIARNEFNFEEVLSSEPGTARRTGFMRRLSRPSYPARLVTRSLHDGGHGRWAMDLVWAVDAPRCDVDMVEMRTRLMGVFSDGWGEGVEQMRFGPRVLDDEGSKTGRYSFNLTTRRAKISLTGAC